MGYRFRTRFLGFSTALHAAPFVSVVMVFPEACPEPHGASRILPVVMLDRPLELSQELPLANANSDEIELAHVQQVAPAEQAGAGAHSEPQETRRGDEVQASEAALAQPLVSKPPLPRGPHFALDAAGEQALASLEERKRAKPETAQAQAQDRRERELEPAKAQAAADTEAEQTDERDSAAVEAQAGAPDPRQEQIVAIVAKINRTVPQAVPIAYINAPTLTAQGITTVRFTLRRDGSIDDLRVVTATGRRDLESSARRVLLMAQPFEYLSGWVEVTLAFFK
ncbi:MAG: energy transducer TonB [Deltaproteobacteria bacterium]|nr:energy transducer TonB [Deltaproteobacteria bacterium]